MYIALGGFLVVQAASALGGSTSGRMPLRWPLFLLPLFPVFVVAGQAIASNPGSLPWLFPFVNAAMVSIPSLSIAALVAWRYSRAHPFAWPVSWREWTTGFVYGAVGATSAAIVINTSYILLMGELLIRRNGLGQLPFDVAITELPRRWGIFLDVSTLSFAGPLDEEFWKGMVVAFFFFRRGGAARCFMWGVLAGTGFNLLETFSNSLGVVSPDALADQTIGQQWWWFAVARSGTAAMHGLAAGLAALGFYGLFRRTPRYLIGFASSLLLHGTWNLLVYAVWGDLMFSRQGPDSTALDVLGLAGMVALFAGSLAMLWVLSGALRDEWPAPIYRLLGMLPAPASPPETRPAPAERRAPEISVA